MPQKLRIAVVGTGQIADSHVSAALALPDVEIACLVDPALDRARALAARYGLAARVAARLSEVLGDVDAAVIATPNDSHASLALECVSAGVAALVEKPLATTAADCERVVAAVEARHATLAVGYSTRFLWNVRFMQELLAAGELGQPRRFAYQYGFPGGWSSYSGYHLDRRAVGGGVLVTTGTHFLDRLLDWFGFPDSVECEDDSRGGPEANARAGFVWTARLAGSARFSRTVQLPGGIAVESERGIALLAESPTAPVRFRPHGSAYESELRPRAGVDEAVAKGIFRLQLEDFVAAVRERRSPRVDARAGLECARLVEALYAMRRPLASDPYHGDGLAP